MKRFLSGVLALCMTLGLTACGTAADSTGIDGAGAQNTAAAMGRWVETPVMLEESNDVLCTNAPVQMADGSLCLYGAENFSEESRDTTLCRFTSTDNGVTWTKRTLGWEQQTGGHILQVSTLSDGTCFFVSYETDENETLSYTGWLKKADSEELAPVTPPEGYSFANPYLLMDDHTLATVILPSGSNGVDQKTILFDLDTGAVTDLGDTSANGTLYGAALDTSNDSPRLCYTSYGEGGARLMALDAKGNTETLLDSEPSGTAGCTVDADGNVYCCSPDGIYRIAKGGSITEQLLPGVGFQFGISSNYCSWLAALPDGSFLVSLMGDSAGAPHTLYRYFWDETLPAQDADGLTVWSLYDNATIRAAIAVYQKENPDIGITYQPALAGGDSEANKADAVAALNTQLLAGEGPDVLILDGMDYEAYIQQGLLADLSDSIDLSSLAQNIVSPFCKADGAYVLPARFSVPIVVGDAGTLAGLASLNDIEQAICSRPARPSQDLEDDCYYTELSPDARYGMGFISVEQLTQFALESSAPALIKNGRVDTDAVRQVLQFVQAVGDHYDMKNYAADLEVNETSMGTDGVDTVVQGDGGYEFDVTKQAQYGWDTLLSAAYFGEMTRDETIGSDAIVRPGLVQGAYLPGTLVAVSAGSKKQEAARAFVQTVFGEEVQNAFQTDGSPVLQSALDASIQKAAQYNTETGYRGDATAFFASLQTPVILDTTVTGTMEKHAEALVNGTETLDDAVTGVENDLSIYLAEKA